MYIYFMIYFMSKQWLSKKFVYASLYCGLLLTMACQKCPETDLVLPTFFGITQTDVNAIAVNNPDESDWQLTEDWNTAERNLFTDKQNLIYSAKPLANKFIYPAYPNANNGNFQLICNQLDSVFICVVNQEGEKIIETKRAGTVAFNFDITDQKERFSEKIARLYYILKTQSGALYKGHGDIALY